MAGGQQGRRRALCAVLVAVSFTIAGIPLAVFLGVWWPSALALVYAVASALVVGADLDADTAEPDHRGRVLGRAFATVPIWAVLAALLAIGLQAVVRFVVDALNRWPGVGWPPDGVAAVVAGIAAVLLVPLAAVLTVTDLSGDLLRRHPTEPSGYEGLVAGSRVPAVAPLVGELLLVAAAVIAWVLDADAAPTIAISVLVLLLGTSGVLLGALPQIVRDGAPGTIAAVEACRTAFADAGFETTRRPSVDEEGVDDLLAEIQFVAERDDRIFAVRVLDGDDPLGWRAAPGVIVAARALAQHTAGPVPVEPVLVLVDAAPEEALLRLSRTESIHVVRIRSVDGDHDVAALAELISPQQLPRGPSEVPS